MSKLFRILILLAVLCFVLSACLQISQPPLPVTGPPATSAKTDKDIPPLPLWTAEETNAVAKELLERTDGVVDITHQKYSYTEMAEDLRLLSEKYPDQLSYRSIGQSAAGRDILLAVLGNPNAPRQIVISAAIHAREYMTTQLVMKQIEFYLTNYRTGTYLGMSYAQLFDRICFYIVPMTNPDGVMLSQEGLDSLSSSPALRTTVENIFQEQKEYKSLNLFLSHWKANARGVDLNRNYDALWEQYNNATKPQSSQFKGYSAASESETKAMVALIDSLPDVACVLCIHSQGEVIYWNCGQEKSLADRTLALARKIADRNGYRVDMDQNNDASLSDWCELKRGIPAVTVETGNEMCPLSVEQFRKIWLDNFDLLPLSALYFENNHT